MKVLQATHLNRKGPAKCPQQRELYLEPPRNLPRILPEASLYNRHLPFPEPFWSPHKNLPEFLCSFSFGWDLIAFRCWGKNFSHQASPKRLRTSIYWVTFWRLDFRNLIQFQDTRHYMNLQFTMPTSSLKNTNLHANKKPPFPKVGPARWSCRQPRLLHRPPPGKKPHHLSSLPSRMLYTTSSRPTSSTSPAAIVELLNQRVALNQRVDPTYETENWYATHHHI